jgi:hypothetical protein
MREWAERRVQPTKNMAFLVSLQRGTQRHMAFVTNQS